MSLHHDASQRLEPAGTIWGWFLVALLDPIFAAAHKLAAFNLEEREGIVRTHGGMRDTHL